MAEQFELKHSLFHGHGLDIEALNLYYARRFFHFVLIRAERICKHGFRRFERARPQALFQLGAVPHNLLFQLGENVIDGSIHVAGSLFAADDAAGIGDGDFYNMAVAFHRQRDMCLSILGEILVQLAYLFDDEIVQVIRNFDVLAGDCDTHPSYPFHAPDPMSCAAYFFRLV